MRHDALLHAPDAHPAWCDCRLCGEQLRREARAELREIGRWAFYGLLASIPGCGAIVIANQWSAIAAWWAAL